MRILITGGAGYIGSHTLLEVLKAGHEVCVIDNLCNSHEEALARVKLLSNRDFRFENADIRDAERITEIVLDFAPEAVIHFAALKAVGKSVADPMPYFDNNIYGTIVLLNALRASDCRIFVFSSSATVYGAPQYVPIDEGHPLSVTNPYGRTKLQMEGMLEDLARSDPSWSVALLRYFNPVGAHVSGTIGEDPNGLPDNVMPFIAQVAVGRLPALSIFGDDYDTPDGTGVRDYIHVTDVATAHLAAVDWCAEGAGGAAGTGRGCEPFNLGTGRGTSVRELVDAFSRACGHEIPTVMGPRRAGDVDTLCADPAKAERVFGWRAVHDVDEMCASSWNWQSKNPRGYLSGE